VTELGASRDDWAEAKMGFGKTGFGKTGLGKRDSKKWDLENRIGRPGQKRD
jgi:hypothetical protein